MPLRLTPPMRAALAAFVCWLCIVSAAFLPAEHMPSALAHQLNQSYLYLQIGESSITARAELPIVDLNKTLSLGFEPDERVGPKQLEPHLDKIKAYVAEQTTLDCGPQPCELSFTEPGYFNTYQSQYLLLNYDLIGFETLPESIQVSYDVMLAEKPANINMLLIEENWKTGTFANESNALLIFEQPGQLQSVDLTAGSLLQGFWGVVKLGVERIWDGVDHVLFLVALLLPSALHRKEGSRWLPVDKFSTAFTYIVKVVAALAIAQSITLCLATLNIVQVPLRFVESVIATSIGLAAIEIFFPIFNGKAWKAVFLFGLFHGFGLADVLGKLWVTSQYTALSLFGFNVGVELGLLAIIAVVFPILYLLRMQRLYNPFLLKTAGLALGAISLYWLIERAFDVNIRVLPILQGLF